MSSGKDIKGSRDPFAWAGEADPVNETLQDDRLTRPVFELDDAHFDPPVAGEANVADLANASEDHVERRSVKREAWDSLPPEKQRQIRKQVAKRQGVPKGVWLTLVLYPPFIVTCAGLAYWILSQSGMKPFGIIFAIGTLVLGGAWVRAVCVIIHRKL